MLVAGGVWLAGSGAAEPADAPSAGGAAATGEVVVLAAASLAEPLRTVASELERQHPGLTVTVSAGPSSALAAQVAEGAPADVLAAASPDTMAVAVDALTAAGHDVDPVVVATNTMALAVPGPAAPGGAGDVVSLADLAGDVRYAVCEPQVPCGEGAAAVLSDVDAAPVTYERDVGAVLAKVAFGEVDAGLVYASDVHPGAPLVREGRVVGVPLDEPDPGDAPWTTSYPVLALPDAPNPAGARAVVAFLVSQQGRAVLRDAGFGPPP
ncbi:molybdate ABC transporter substrate-binding protein [Actinotalea ferrariae]|nr:molybdate ABC transporter substrate-binding protein [Actinotalea ferrariae]